MNNLNNPLAAAKVRLKAQLVIISHLRRALKEAKAAEDLLLAVKNGTGPRRADTELLVSQQLEAQLCIHTDEARRMKRDIDDFKPARKMKGGKKRDQAEIYAWSRSQVPQEQLREWANQPITGQTLNQVLSEITTPASRKT